MTADPERDKMALSELLSTVPPGHRDQPWTWDDEERNLRLRLCLCCGKPGHHQQVIEERIRESGFVSPVCIGEDGKLHDGHHRVIAAKTLGFTEILLESRAEADERSRQDHGSYVWELRRFGDANPGGEFDHVQYVRQSARDFVEWEADALAARLEAAEARATEAERVIVELRKHHDDLSAERGVAVARLAAEPGRNDMSEPEYEVSQRGFKYLAPLTCTYGTEVRVYESSAAESPHLWVALKETRLEGRGEAHAHLSFEQARKLRDQLDWLLDNHYQVAAAQQPPAERSRTICGAKHGHLECMKHDGHNGEHSWEPLTWPRQHPPAEGSTRG